MSRACAYMVNEHPLYMNMASNSIAMLRRHNPEIEVVVFLVEDLGRLTFDPQMLQRPYPGLEIEGEVRARSESFTRWCRVHGATLHRRTANASDPDYIHANQCYVAEVRARDVLVLDADTFVFGDIAAIFDAYAPFDVAAPAAGWFAGMPGWDPAWLGGREPLSTCVVLWNGGRASAWADFLARSSVELAAGDSAMARWLDEHAIRHIREELSLSLMIDRIGLNAAVLGPGAFENHPAGGGHRATIVHTFAYNWRKFYREVSRSEALPLDGTEPDGSGGP